MILLIILYLVINSVKTSSSVKENIVRIKRNEEMGMIRIPIEQFFNITNLTIYPLINTKTENVTLLTSMLKTKSGAVGNSHSVALKGLKKSKYFAKILFESRISNKGSELRYYQLEDGYERMEESTRVLMDGKNCRMMDEETLNLEKEIVICYQGLEGAITVINERVNRVITSLNFRINIDEGTPDWISYSREDRDLYAVSWKIKEGNVLGVRFFEIDNNRIKRTNYFARRVKHFKDVYKLIMIKDGELFLMLGEDDNEEYRIQEISFNFTNGNFEYGNHSILNFSKNTRIFKLEEQLLIFFNRERDTMDISIFKIKDDSLTFELIFNSQQFTWYEDYEVSSVRRSLDTEFVIVKLTSFESNLEKMAILPLRDNIHRNRIEFLDASREIIQTANGIYFEYKEDENRTIILEWSMPLESILIQIDPPTCQQTGTIELEDRSMLGNYQKRTFRIECYDDYGEFIETGMEEYYQETIIHGVERDTLILETGNFFHGFKGNIIGINSPDNDLEIIQSRKVEDLTIIKENYHCVDFTCYFLKQSESGRNYLYARSGLFTSIKGNFSRIDFSKKITKKIIKEEMEIKAVSPIILGNGMRGNILVLMSEDKVALVLHGLEIDFIPPYRKEVSGMFLIERSRGFSDDIWLIGRFGDSVSFAGCKFKICQIVKYPAANFNLDSIEEVRDESISFDRSKLAINGDFCPKKFYGNLEHDVGFLKASCREEEHRLFRFSFKTLGIPKLVRIDEIFEKNDFEICFFRNFYAIFSLNSSTIKIYSRFSFPMEDISFDMSNYGIQKLKNVACIDDLLVVIHQKDNTSEDTMTFFRLDPSNFYIDALNLVNKEENIGFETKTGSINTMRIHIRQFNKRTREGYLIRLQGRDGSRIGLICPYGDSPLILLRNLDKKGYLNEYNFTVNYRTGTSLRSQQLSGIILNKKRMKKLVKLRENITKKKIKRGIYEMGQFVERMDLVDFIIFKSRGTRTYSFFDGLPHIPGRVFPWEKLSDFSDRVILATVRHKDLTLIVSSSKVSGNICSLFFYMNFTSEVKNNNNRFQEIYEEEFYLVNPTEYFFGDILGSYGVYKDSDREFIFVSADFDKEKSQMGMKVQKLLKKNSKGREFFNSKSNDISFYLDIERINDRSLTIVKVTSDDQLTGYLVFIPVIDKKGNEKTLKIRIDGQSLSILEEKQLDFGIYKNSTISTDNSLQYFSIGSQGVSVRVFSFEDGQFGNPRSLNLTEFQSSQSKEGQARCAEFNLMIKYGGRGYMGVCIFWMNDRVMNPVIVRFEEDLTFEPLTLVVISLIPEFEILNVDLNAENVILTKMIQSQSLHVTCFNLKKWWDSTATEEEIKRMILPTEDLSIPKDAPTVSKGKEYDSSFLFYQDGQAYWTYLGERGSQYSLRTFKSSPEFSFSIKTITGLRGISSSLENSEVRLIFFDDSFIKMNLEDFFERDKFIEVILWIVWLVLILLMCLSRTVFIYLGKRFCKKVVAKRRRKKC